MRTLPETYPSVMDTDLLQGQEPQVDDQLDAALLAELPPGTPPAVTPPPAAQAPDTSQYVTREQYAAQQAEIERLRSVAPIAEELARNPQLAEQLRRQLILGDVAAPGTRATTEQPAISAPPQPQPLSDDQRQKLVNALVTNPEQVLGAIAKAAEERAYERARADQNAAMDPMREYVASSTVRNFKADRRTENADEFKFVEPYFQRALDAIPPAQLAAMPPAQVENFLQFAYRAARGDAYAEAQKQSGSGGGGGLAALPAGTPSPAGAQPSAPPYAGAAGAPAAAQTAPLVRNVQQQRFSPAAIDLAKRSGLTQTDIKKYGPAVIDEMVAS